MRCDGGKDRSFDTPCRPARAAWRSPPPRHGAPAACVGAIADHVAIDADLAALVVLEQVQCSAAWWTCRIRWGRARPPPRPSRRRSSRPSVLPARRATCSAPCPAPMAAGMAASLPAYQWATREALLAPAREQREGIADQRSRSPSRRGRSERTASVRSTTSRAAYVSSHTPTTET